MSFEKNGLSSSSSNGNVTKKVSSAADEVVKNSISPSGVASPGHNGDSTPFKDFFIIIVTLSILFFTFYLTYYLWRKHRQRPVATLYKVQEYSYSRLSQNEVDAEGRLRSYTDLQNPDIQSEDEEKFKPATLEMESDSLITISNPKCTSTSANVNSNSSPSNNGIVKPFINMGEASDEDLLQ